MNPKTPILIYRQYLQTLSDIIFPQMIIFKNSSLLYSQSLGETGADFFNSLVISFYVSVLDNYFKKLLHENKKPTISIKLTEPEIIVLYKILMEQQIHFEKEYVLMVRQEFITKLEPEYNFIKDKLLYQCKK